MEIIPLLSDCDSPKRLFHQLQQPRSCLGRVDRMDAGGCGLLGHCRCLGLPGGWQLCPGNGQSDAANATDDRGLSKKWVNLLVQDCLTATTGESHRLGAGKDG
jgi:hypothetical protein